MTENLAGRGEELAGRIEEIVCRGKHKRGGPACQASCGIQVRMILAALEAAAPAGTPDVFDFVGRKMATHLVETMQALEGFAEPVRAAGQSALEEFWFRATGHHIDWDSLAPEVRAEDLTAALATPSPQAPPPANLSAGDIAWGIAEEFSAGPLLYGEKSVLAYRIAKAIHADRLAQLAATQEQPAGSARVVTDLQIALRIVGDWKEDSRGLVHVHKDVIRKAIVAALRSAGNCGSPRKVGEDARRCCESGNFGEPHVCCKAPGNLPTNIADLRERLFRLDRLLCDPHPGLMTWNEAYGKAVANVLLFWDTSSVPVGEQKQEEGV